MDGLAYRLTVGWMPAVVICYLIKVMFTRKMLVGNKNIVNNNQESVHSGQVAELTFLNKINYILDRFESGSKRMDVLDIL